jgi:hypothetical protein
MKMGSPVKKKSNTPEDFVLFLYLFASTDGKFYHLYP